VTITCSLKKGGVQEKEKRGGTEDTDRVSTIMEVVLSTIQGPLKRGGKMRVNQRPYY